MYFPTLEASTGKLLQLTLSPMRICRFRLNRARDEEADWLAALLRHESRMPVERLADGRLRLR
jgi:poly-gamma-glutamate synthesis protein (capsule biosynthesis protein)